MIQVKELIRRADLAASFGERAEAIALLKLARQQYIAWWASAGPYEKFQAMANQTETNLLLRIAALEVEAEIRDGGES